MLWLITTVALAGPGFFHPQDLMVESQQFAVASEAGAKANTAQRDAEAIAVALDQYRTALDLMGDRAPAAEYERLESLKQRYNQEYAVLNAFLGTLVEDVNEQFIGSMERALAAHPDAVPCARQVPSKMQLPGAPVRLEDNPECTGDDLNGAIAAAMDADADLKANLDEIMGLEWPPLTVPTDAQAPTGGDTWVGVYPFFSAQSGATLKAIEREEEALRDPILAEIEMGASLEEKKAMIDKAKQITATIRQSRTDAAAAVFTASDKSFAKLKPAFGWCANPVALGGCTGTQASAAQVQTVADDKKISKALP